tara:strand:- start:212 stop:454 length:243 start_codon:yes stop_codon:yes gene_type:complete
MCERIDHAAREGTIKRLHVDQHRVRNGDRNVVTVQTSKGPFKAAEVEWDGPSKLVYRPDTPLGCGAKVWIETTSPVKVIH